MQDPMSLVDEWGPEKIICVSDSRTGMKGVLVIDNTARGMAKGGTRMSPTVSVQEMCRLARVMSWKWAMADIFFGGAKAGIQFDPASSRKEEALRAWARALEKHIPSEYVLGLDMGLAEPDAAVVQDELGDRGASVGTPYDLGGIPYDELGYTGYGVAECANVAADFASIQLQGSSVAIQGFGAVGSAAAKRLVDYGSTVTAVATASGAIYNPDGLDVSRLLKMRSEFGDDLVNHYEDAKALNPGDELELGADIVIPAARQDVIDEHVADRLRARVIVEGANLPTTPEAKQILHNRGVVVVPDFVANAGAVISTGVAMDARYSSVRPDTDSIYTLIAEKLRTNCALVLETATKENKTSYEAALSIAQERVRTAMKLKGRI